MGAFEMAIQWTLKKLLLAQGICNARQLSKALETKTGVCISPQSLQKLLNKPPEKLRIETAQYLCNLLQVPLNEFMTINPEPLIPHGEATKPYGSKVKQDLFIFKNPREHFR